MPSDPDPYGFFDEPADDLDLLIPGWLRPDDAPVPYETIAAGWDRETYRDPLEWRILLNPDTFEGTGGFIRPVAEMDAAERADLIELLRNNVNLYHRQALTDEQEATSGLMQWLMVTLDIGSAANTHPHAWLRTMPFYRALTAPVDTGQPDPCPECDLPPQPDPFSINGKTAHHQHHNGSANPRRGGEPSP